ncbi:4-hydroxybenzoate 3-monooxygenase [Chelatococcus sp. GCM10030263]|uniref:4-hydroxybenzoate 3-monooxygenase n=1 Tax=Chelatococcus sp. GCM10030263 TaxID=3273387 RepID=UPI0036148B60
MGAGSRKLRRTQVGIVGAGPAGLLLSHLLHLSGIDSVVIEARSRAHVENRIRAGVLEQGTVDLLREAGVADRLGREGLMHGGIILRFGGHSHRIDFVDLAGKGVTVYGQHEVVKDLIARTIADGHGPIFEASGVGIHDITGERPVIRYLEDGAEHEIACDFIAGCDGFHGICREAIPADALTIYEREYPFGWLGILAEAPPSSEELIYANHARGFALLSMRSPQISRLYLQCDPHEDLAQWPDARIWEELHRRLDSAAGHPLYEGLILQKSVTGMRSFVAEPMRWGRLFLAGDAAHIVPPTGAKGMNLAAADVRALCEVLTAFYRTGDAAVLDSYSPRCIARVWKAQRFSWWMTSMLHLSPEMSAFDRRRQLAELDYVATSRAAATTLAENYVGLPFTNDPHVAPAPWREPALSADLDGEFR